MKGGHWETLQDGDALPDEAWHGLGWNLRWFFGEMTDEEESKLFAMLAGLPMSTSTCQLGAQYLDNMRRCMEHDDCKEHPELGRACFESRR